MLEMSVGGSRAGIVSGVSKACHFFFSIFMVAARRPAEKLRARSGEGLSQFAAQDFARCSFRNGVHEVDVARLFVMGKPIGNESAEFFFELVASGKSIAQGDEGDWDFSGCRVEAGDPPALFFPPG